MVNELYNGEVINSALEPVVFRIQGVYVLLLFGIYYWRNWAFRVCNSLQLKERREDYALIKD